MALPYGFHVLVEKKDNEQINKNKSDIDKCQKDRVGWEGNVRKSNQIIIY